MKREIIRHLNNKMSNKDIEINIKSFDIRKIKKDSIVITIGKRRTGKSFLVKDILYHNRSIPLGMVISRTDHLSHFYDKFIPGMFIHSRYSSEVIDKLFKRQEKAIKQGWDDPYAFLLFDDCLADAKNWNKDERVKEIFFNGRWYKLLFILTMQAPMAIPPDLRTNIDFTFILKNNNSADREKIYKHYAGVFPSREIFEHVLDACTEDHYCLVIDNTTHSNKLEDQVFMYRAAQHEDFRMCSNKLWTINEERYDDNNKDASSSIRSEVKTKRGNQKLIIKKKS